MTANYLYMLQQHFRLSLCETTQARQRVQCRMPATAMQVSLHVQYSESTCSVHTGYVFFETLGFLPGQVDID